MPRPCPGGVAPARHGMTETSPHGPETRHPGRPDGWSIPSGPHSPPPSNSPGTSRRWRHRTTRSRDPNERIGSILRAATGRRSRRRTARAGDPGASTSSAVRSRIVHGRAGPDGRRERAPGLPAGSDPRAARPGLVHPDQLHPSQLLRPGTPVRTLTGPKAIETIESATSCSRRTRDRQLGYRPVVMAHHNPPSPTFRRHPRRRRGRHQPLAPLLGRRPGLGHGPRPEGRRPDPHPRRRRAGRRRSRGPVQPSTTSTSRATPTSSSARPRPWSTTTPCPTSAAPFDAPPAVAAK